MGPATQASSVEKVGKAAGNAANVVTDYVHIKGEARSPDAAFAAVIAKACEEAFAKAQAEVKDAGGETAEVKFTNQPAYPPFNLTEVLRHAKRAAESLGLKQTTIFSNGGLDANGFDKYVPTVTIGSGHYEIHTVKEYLDLAEFANGCRLAVALRTRSRSLAVSMSLMLAPEITVFLG
jgi:tripeptide aminopeptidase